MKLSALLASGEWLGEALAQFAARYPRLRLDIDLSGRKVDLVAEGFDVALRPVREASSAGRFSRKMSIVG